MLGAIIGDIIGSAYEFHPTNDYNFKLFTDKSHYTDDTLCTIGIANAILDQEGYEMSLHKWCQEYKSDILGFGGRFRKWVDSNEPQPYGSYGNGSAMRVSPVGMFFFDKPERLYDEATRSAECTHNHPEGIRGAVCVATAIARAIRMFDGEKSPIHIKELTKLLVSDLLREFYPDVDANYELYRNKFDETCQGTVPPALDIIRRSYSFEDAIRRAVSLGADADTLGAIVGSIAEHIWGIPDDIREKAYDYLPLSMIQTLARFYNIMEGNPNYKPLTSEIERIKEEEIERRRKELEAERQAISKRNLEERMAREKKKLDERMEKTKDAEFFMEIIVAGSRYVYDQNIFYHFEENDILTLRHENNPHDANAVDLYFDDKKIGYVPRNKNHELAQLLKRGLEHMFVAYVRKWEGWGDNRKITVTIMQNKNCMWYDGTDNHKATLPLFDVIQHCEHETLKKVLKQLPEFRHRITPKIITELHENEIFVFGSNTQGHHMGGAARVAMEKFGAEWGQGHGLHGRTYAISTMEGLMHMAVNINKFIRFADEHPDLHFLVTPVACGIAGYNPLQIAPLFRQAILLPNISLPLSFWEYFWLSEGIETEWFHPEHDWDKWDNC